MDRLYGENRYASVARKFGEKPILWWGPNTTSEPTTSGGPKP